MSVEEGKRTVMIVSDAVKLAAVPIPSTTFTAKDTAMNSAVLDSHSTNLYQIGLTV